MNEVAKILNMLCKCKYKCNMSLNFVKSTKRKNNQQIVTNEFARLIIHINL